MQYSPNRFCAIILATGVLHNLAVDANVPIVDADVDAAVDRERQINQQLEAHLPGDDNNYADGAIARHEVINRLN